MKERIRQRAFELGFDDCRFTTATAPEHASVFERWLAAGMHGQMAYLERNASKRLDLQKVLAGAQSVITLAVSYAQTEIENRESKPEAPPSAPPNNPGAPPALPKSEIRNPKSGTVARYARYRDYHLVMGERLKTLAEYVDGLGQEKLTSLWYVDTGPVLERDAAQRAGLGFIGKHTNLISRRFGNWILLGEILTSLRLEPDVSERNHCGHCTRCLAACPTGAIPAPFQVDARRCISYLTIELKESIPEELRPEIGDRVFGCDDCLAVCPWNRFAREGSMMKAHARDDLAQVDLLELLELDEAGFRRRFDGTPLLRAKRRGLRRNVCVALGNVGGPEALPVLEKVALESDALVAEHARWALEQVKARSSRTGASK